MELTEEQVARIIQIIRQYAVIYGGGISSSDAYIREECEKLVAALEGHGGTTPAERLLDLRKRVEADEREQARKVAVLAKIEGKANKASAAKKGETSSAKIGGSKTASALTATAKAAPTPKSTTSKKKAEPEVKPARSSAPERSSAQAPTVAASKPVAAPEAEKAVVPLGATKPAAGVKPGQAPQMGTHWRESAAHLWEAYRAGRFPRTGGYIVSFFFDDKGSYAVFELVGYENLQELTQNGDQLVFKSFGCKLYGIVEPTNYSQKSVEPVHRPQGYAVPYRFSEVVSIKTKKHQNVHIGKKPIVSQGSFSIVRPETNDLAILFYSNERVFQNIQDFLIVVLTKELAVPADDARTVSQKIVSEIQKFHLWLDQEKQ